MTWTQIEKFCTGFLGMVHVGFGVSILAGGAMRFPPPTYDPLLRFTDGQVWPYGLLFFVAGILMFFPGWRTRFAGLAAGVVACDTFAALFLVAVVKFPDAGGTAWWAYFCFGSQASILAALVWAHRPRRTREVD